MSLLKDFILWLYWYPFRVIARTLPPPALYAMARLSAALLYVVAARKRRALEREYDCLPKGLSITKKEAVVGALFNFSAIEFEVLIYDRLEARTLDSFVTVEGLENLDAALTTGKGAMLLFGHFGANQMVMPAIGYREYRMCQISAPSTVWEEVMPEVQFTGMQKRALQLRWRQELALPVKHINVFGSLKEAFRCLNRNEVLGIAVDGGKGADRLEADFLGGRAMFSGGPFEIARRTGCAVLPVFMLRHKDGHNLMVVHPALRRDDSTDIEGALKEFLSLFEAYIIRHPDMYLNFMALRSFMASRGDTPLFVQ